MKKLRKYEHFIVIIIGLVIVVLEYMDSVSIVDSIGLAFIGIGIIIMFGKYVWKKNNPKP
jgi:hypothetical protein|tara:strand:+ start:655 stop:834 length:180 start_codon:yes stop_codon:yes gene_type:complete